LPDCRSRDTRGAAGGLGTAVANQWTPPESKRPCACPGAFGFGEIMSGSKKPMTLQETQQLSWSFNQPHSKLFIERAVLAVNDHPGSRQIPRNGRARVSAGGVRFIRPGAGSSNGDKPIQA
jgi:hypothetical protein